MYQEKVERLVKKYKTNDPFMLARENNIKILFSDLGHLRGLYQYYKRVKIIVINDTLPYQMQRVVCAHELGHALLHPKLNRFFLHQSTFQNCDRWEREADLFATFLLIDELDARGYFLEGVSSAHISAITGLTLDLVEERMRIFAKGFLIDTSQIEDVSMQLE